MKSILLTTCLSFLALCSTFSNAQSLTWVKQSGTLGETCNPIATKYDNSGNLIVIGNYSGTVDFDPNAGITELTAISGQDAFIQKLDPSGNLLWVKSINDSINNVGSPLSIDALDNIYILGIYSNTVDFDPGIAVNNQTSFDLEDLAILKLTANGDFIWVKSIGGTGYDSAISIVCENTNCYLLGKYNALNTVDFDPNLGVTNITDNATTAIVKLDTAGNFVWAKGIGSPNYDYPVNLMIDQNGDVLSLGRFTYDADFDPGPATLTLGNLTGGVSTYVLKLDPAGTFLWAKAFVPTFNSGVGFELSGSIATDSQNNIYVGTTFYDTTDFNPDDVSNFIVNPVLGALNGFIVKLNQSGAFQWVNTYTTLSFGYSGFDIEGNNLYTLGSYENNLVITDQTGNFTINSNGFNDVLIHKLDLAGNTISTKHFGGSGYDGGSAIDVNNMGKLAISGRFQQSVDFDPDLGNTTLTSVASSDAFVATFSLIDCSSIETTLDSIHTISCTTTGQIFTTTAGGSPPYSYSWNNNLLLDQPFLTIDSTGIYSLVVTDNNGCQDSISVVVTDLSFSGSFDLNVNLISSDFRPGYEATIEVDAFNDGCLPVSGQLKLAYDPLLDFVSSSPAPTSQNGDTLIWDFTDITYDSAHLTPQIVFNTSTQAVIGDTIHFTTIITPIAGDADTTNNVKYYSSPVVNGYDPNIKSVYPVGKCDVGYIKQDQLLTYTVQFQNTGNSEAINIAVIDSLDTDLDLNTVRIVGKSHPMWTEVLPGNVLKFHFDNIQLPDSTTNEPESHGYVVFEAKPVSTWLNQNTEISNLADIYFDFNPPIRTNEVSNLIFQNDLDNYNCLGAGIEETSVAEWMVFPNPANNQITIRTNQEFADETIFITDLQGKIVLSKEHVNGSEATINVTSLNDGVYLIRTQTSIALGRLVKQ
jgi:uncharacterized repeat protein (TIGR01451 family)